jgi:hypothetical protein
VGEQGDIAIQRLKAVDQPVRARSDVLGGFLIWTAIDKDVPARPLLGDIRRAFALIIAIIPLGQVRLDLGESPKPGQLAGSLRALPRAAQGRRELDVLQPGSKPPRLLLAMWVNGMSVRPVCCPESDHSVSRRGG